MARHYQSPEAMCPFYRMEERNAIHCEGISPDASMTLQWEKPADQYRQRFCYGDWTCCKVARMLWAKYDDPDNLRYMKNETANRNGLGGIPGRERRLWEAFLHQIKGNRP